MLDHLYIPKKNMMVLFWAMETDFTSMSGGRMKEVLGMFDRNVIDFESLPSCWLSGKRFKIFNIITSWILWGLWLKMVINHKIWLNTKQVWKHILTSVWERNVPIKDAEAVDLDRFGAPLMENLRTPLRSWRGGWCRSCQGNLLPSRHSSTTTSVHI